MLTENTIPFLLSPGTFLPDLEVSIFHLEANYIQMAKTPSLRRNSIHSPLGETSPWGVDESAGLEFGGLHSLVPDI